MVAMAQTPTPTPTEAPEPAPPAGLALLRRPRWVLGHVVVLVAVIAFVNLGQWQLRRLDERQAYNATVSSQMAADPVPITDLDDVLAQGEAAASYRRVLVRGSFDVDGEVLLSTRSQDGVPGHHVLTPIVPESGPTVLVDRGWVPLDAAQAPPVEAAPPPDGPATVTGVLFPSIDADRSGTLGGAPEPLEFMSQVDLGRYAQVAPGALYPLYVLAQDVDPAPAEGLPAYGPLPELSEGSHRSYAMQWFLFAAVVAIGYPVLVWRTATGASGTRPTPDAGGGGATRPRTGGPVRSSA